MAGSHDISTLPVTFVGRPFLGAPSSGNCMRSGERRKVALKVVEQRCLVGSLRRSCIGLFPTLALATRKPRGKSVAPSWVTVFSYDLQIRRGSSVGSF